ncbi:MAG: carboxypeptidase regulatory-like domain-containing protein [Deltaproteobacteria bacterium]|nr:carboxypeptidase regulatory-like domain-containing protein [Deltaproteobacteria bacterium]
MNRKLAGGVVAILVVALGVWLLFLRGGGGPDDGAAGDGAGGRAAKIDPVTGKPDRTGEIDGVNVRGAAAAGRWTIDPDPDGPLRMEGQVVGPDGKGVGGAEVFISTAPPRTITANDDGTFVFEKLLGRTYRLTAKNKELIGGPSVCKLTAKSDPCRIQLAEAAAVEVTVVDEQKAPVAGAEVHDGDRMHGVATTDARGVATLRPVHPGWLAVVATFGGYAPASAFTTVGSAGALAKVTIVLRKGFAVSGRVLDEGGRPIANAHVFPAGVWFDEDRAANPAISDASGKFTVEAIPPGTHALVALHRERAPGRAQVTVIDKAVTGVEITMKSGASVAGTVVDGAGKPVPFATVQVAGTSRQPWQESRRATTDDRGAFEIRGLPRTKLLARASNEVAASAIADVDLLERDVRDLKLTLDVNGTISGIVVNDAGAPVTEIQVQAFPDVVRGDAKAGAVADMTSATTDGAGAFTLEGLPEGKYRLSVSRSNARRWDWEKATPASTGDKDVRIVLPSPATLVGKVALQGGGAPSLAQVQVGVQAATPVYDGAFTIKDITPGTYAVTIRGPEFAQLVKHDITLTAGKTTDLGTLTVARGRRLSGRVVDASGGAVPGAKVKLAEMLFASADNEDQWESFEENAGVRSSVTDQDGAFTLIGIPSEKQTTVTAAHPSLGRAIAMTVPEGTDDPPPIILQLKGYGSISGVVTMKGEPQAGIGVTQTAKGGALQVAVAQTDDNGAFRMTKVPEGTHVLQAMKQERFTGSFKSSTVTATVTAGAETKVTIDIPVGNLSLAVTVKALPGNKVDWAQTFLLKPGSSPSTGKEIMRMFTSGAAVGMKFWFGGDSAMPEYEELVAGDYALCTIPVTGGKFEDSAFQQKLQENVQSLKVYCKPITVAAAPAKQQVVHEVPAMSPFPPAPTN